jgi:hypothetical protein
MVLSLIAALCLVEEPIPCLADPFTGIEQCAVLAIVGEAEGESMQGKIAVAEVIRRRGSLKGVYGHKSNRVVNKHYSASCYADSVKAWELSKTSNLTDEADGWGNESDIRKFKTQAWFKNCRVIKQIGNHYFWKDIRNGIKK